MTGRNFVAAETGRELIERSELQPAITGDTGNRSFAAQVALDKRLHYIAFKLAFEVEDVKRKTKLFADAACVVNVVKRTTARRQRITVFVDTDAAPLVPQLHREADQVVPLLLEQRGRRRRIHTT